MSDFLKHFFDERGRVNRFTEDDLNSVNNDKWDKSDFNAIISELREFADAEEQLAEFTRTGGRAMEDCFYAMMKAVPSLKESNEVRTDHLINKFVMDEAMGLSEYDELREFSVGDIVSSGLGCRDMEPELEEIFDRTKTAQEELDKLYDQMASMAEFEDQSDSLEELIQQAQEQGNQGEARDYQQQQQQINDAMEKLRQEIQDGAGKAEQEMDDARQDVRSALRAGMEKAIESGELMEDASLMWGQERGTLHRLDPEKRIALARKLQNEKFKLVAQLIGAMIRLAFAEQHRKTLQAQNEVFDIEKGNDLSRVLPAEMIGLSDDVISLDFFSRFFDHGLLQYKMRGTERVAKGDIIVLEDGSGSMGGNREVWAKAVSIALLHVAKQQGRGFTGIHFGSANEYKKFEWNFREGNCETDYCGQEFEKLSFMDSVIHFAEFFLGGGTEFTTPLSLALDKLNRQFEERGEVKGDIVFITDGECGVPQDWLDNFQEMKAKLGFRVWGIMIGGNERSEPFYTICDGRTYTVKDFSTGSDIRSIFGGV